MNNYFYTYMYLRSHNSIHGKVGSPYYVGKGKGSRAFDKKHRSKPPIDPANIVFVATKMNEPDAVQLEMLLIHMYGRIDKGTGCLANLSDGGEGQHGRIQPESEKRAKSEWMKAHPNRGNEVCPKWPKGKPRHQETKDKQSASWTEDKRKSHSSKMRGNQNGVGNKGPIGQKQSDATKRKRALAITGMRRSEETKLHLRASWTEERRKLHTEKMTGRKGHPAVNKGTSGLYKHSEETKRRLKDAWARRKIRVPSEETRLKMTLGQRASWERRKQIPIGV